MSKHSSAAQQRDRASTPSIATSAGARQVTRTEAPELVDEFRASGNTLSQFAHDKGVSFHSLRSWLAPVRKMATSVQVQAVSGPAANGGESQVARIVELHVRREDVRRSHLEVVIRHGRRIRVANDFDEDGTVPGQRA